MSIGRNGITGSKIEIVIAACVITVALIADAAGNNSAISGHINHGRRSIAIDRNHRSRITAETSSGSIGLTNQGTCAIVDGRAGNGIDFRCRSYAAVIRGTAKVSGVPGDMHLICGHSCPLLYGHGIAFSRGYNPISICTARGSCRLYAVSGQQPGRIRPGIDRTPIYIHCTTGHDNITAGKRAFYSSFIAGSCRYNAICNAAASQQAHFPHYRFFVLNGANCMDSSTVGHFHRCAFCQYIMASDSPACDLDVQPSAHAVCTEVKILTCKQMHFFRTCITNGSVCSHISACQADIFPLQGSVRYLYIAIVITIILA